MKFGIMAILLIWLCDLYFKKSWELEEASRIFISMGTVVAISSMFQPEFGFAQQPIIAFLAWGALALCALSARMAVRSIPLTQRAMATPMIIIGDGMDATDLASQLRESRAFRADIVGHYSVADFKRMIAGAPAVGIAGSAGKRRTQPSGRHLRRDAVGGRSTESFPISWKISPAPAPAIWSRFPS